MHLLVRSDRLAGTAQLRGAHRHLGQAAAPFSAKKAFVKVLVVSEDVPYPNMGGLGKHALALARALGQQSHIVDFMGNADQVLVADDPDLKLPGRFFAELKGTQDGWKETRLGCFNPFKRPVIARGLASAILARADDYDVVHYHGHFPNVAAYIPAHVNFVQTRHDQGSDCLIHTRFRNGEICTETDPAVCAGCIAAQPNHVQRKVSTSAVRIFRKEVVAGFGRHKTIFVSDMLRRNFARSAGPCEWGTVVHNFLVTSQFKDVLSGRNARPQQDGKIEILIAAKLYPPKGVDQFLAAAAGKLPPHIHISIAGAGPDEEMLRGRFAGAQVSFLGWQDYPAIIQLTASADAVVVPSVWEEPCATTVLEALYLGRQVLALARGGTPELQGYVEAKSQLCLYSDMASLVRGLTAVRRVDRASLGTGDEFSVERRLPELLQVYRAKNP